MPATRTKPAERDRRLDEIRDRLRASGRRWTVAKGAVVETMLAGEGHLSVLQIHDEVSRRYPQIDRSTVHRVLLVLTDERVIHALDQRGGARYGLSDHPHHHAVCTACGREEQIPAAVVDRLLVKAGAEVGFRFDRDSITLTGTCSTCTAE
ncbi:Fur family transcriptional regulator [Micromonosporaceae bacterium Da 78-11]